MGKFVITVEHGAPAQRAINFAWDDGSARDVTSLSAVLTVYAGSGDETAPVFSSAAAPGATADEQVWLLTAENTMQPKPRYYATIDLVDGTGAVVADGRWHGGFVVEGAGGL